MNMSIIFDHHQYQNPILRFFGFSNPNEEQYNNNEITLQFT